MFFLLAPLLLITVNGITISVDANDVQGNVSRDLFGEGLEMSKSLFRSIFDSSTQTFKDPPLSVTKEMGLTSLRFGGGSAESYDWEQGVGEVSQRNQSGRYSFGFEEWWQYARELNASLTVTVNVVLNDSAKAARWVAYAKNKGIPVKYWEMGNEVNLFGVSANEYGDRFNRYCSEMKAQDSSVKCGLVVDPFNRVYENPQQPMEYYMYDNKVLAKAGSNVDFLIPHFYVPYNYWDGTVVYSDSGCFNSTFFVEAGETYNITVFASGTNITPKETHPNPFPEGMFCIDSICITKNITSPYKEPDDWPYRLGGPWENITFFDITLASGEHNFSACLLNDYWDPITKEDINIILGHAYINGSTGSSYFDYINKTKWTLDAFASTLLLDTQMSLLKEEAINNTGHEIPFVFSEYSFQYHSLVLPWSSPEMYDWRSGIIIALEMQKLISSRRVLQANQWTDPGTGYWTYCLNSQGTRQIPFYVMNLFSNHTGETRLNAVVSGVPTYSSKVQDQLTETPFLTAIASKSADGRKLFLNVVSKNVFGPMRASINLNGFTPTSAKAFVLTAPSLDSNNTFSEVIKIVEQSAPVQQSFEYEFRPYSITVIEFESVPPPTSTSSTTTSSTTSTSASTTSSQPTTSTT
ncbi:hypothetical protein HY991_03340, partial [Candidatus Micrarchaeota archaeon]|nr:hypothetical protein [Candidatus Micrarchaeota archaeon]